MGSFIDVLSSKAKVCPGAFGGEGIQPQVHFPTAVWQATPQNLKHGSFFPLCHRLTEYKSILSAPWLQNCPTAPHFAREGSTGYHSSSLYSAYKVKCEETCPSKNSKLQLRQKTMNPLKSKTSILHVKLMLCHSGPTYSFRHSAWGPQKCFSFFKIRRKKNERLESKKKF